MTDPLHVTGFSKMEAPALLREVLLRWLAVGPVENESVEGFITAESGRQPSLLQPLPDGIKALVHALLREPVQLWCGRELHPTYVYGIRTYLRSSQLKMHRDREGTHQVSVIINVAQQGMVAPWPLHIEDHAGQRHRIFLSPGEMIFYEGERLLHGRPEPLDGESFSNVFVHYRLA